MCFSWTVVTLIVYREFKRPITLMKMGSVIFSITLIVVSYPDLTSIGWELPVLKSVLWACTSTYPLTWFRLILIYFTVGSLLMYLYSFYCEPEIFSSIARSSRNILVLLSLEYSIARLIYFWWLFVKTIKIMILLATSFTKLNYDFFRRSLNIFVSPISDTLSGSNFTVFAWYAFPFKFLQSSVFIPVHFLN